MSTLIEFDEWYEKEEPVLLEESHTLRKWLERAFKAGAAIGYQQGAADQQEPKE